jgi:PAT family beta-lactamase induction signal transducer AmpG
MEQMLKKITSRKMLVIAFLGLTSGIPLGVVMSLLQTWMTESGIDLKLVGMAALVQMPYTLKFLWSPIIDRYSLPFLGRRNGWMLLCQLGIFFSLQLFGAMDPKVNLTAVIIMATCISFFGASHDIVIDAYRRDILEENELGFGSAVATNSYLIGFKFLATVLGLALADQYPWSTVFNILSYLCILGVIAAIVAPQGSNNDNAPKKLKDAVILPFLDFLKRHRSVEILIFILLYKIGDNIAGNMATPFYLEMGFSKTEIAFVGKMIGFWCMFAGGFIGGAILLKHNIMKCLIWFGILQALSTFAFALLTLSNHNIFHLGLVVGIENITTGMGTSAFAAFMLRLCDVRFSATQYALLTSFMGIPRTILPAAAGFIAQPLGWFGFFTVCTLIAIPGLLMVQFRLKKLLL